MQPPTANQAPPTTPARSRLFWITLGLGATSALIVPINVAVFLASPGFVSAPFIGLALLQFSTGAAASVCGIVLAARRSTPRGGTKVLAIVVAVVAALLALGGPLAIALAVFAQALGDGMAGGAWGRPLRVRGRVLHPGLSAGSNWTRGNRPSIAGLDPATCAALEALWLHDAQKEHASVPAFARISWLLAAVGAPAELVEGAHRAAAEEIDHARRCFALAAGYGGRSHSAEPMPDLLLGGLDMKGDPMIHLAVESLEDGCLLEDFNADVAAACEAVCEERATKDVLARIAREERSHAELSWDLLRWLVARGGTRVAGAVARKAAALDSVKRPTAVSTERAALVAAADPVKLRMHGRLSDAEWAALWDVRVESTRRRARALREESDVGVAA
jgi:hypothetical protein